ncbi:MAG: retropepsin-like domain-containing protein [Acidobacteria bacterium]|nr:retropepsin-like domain-containing protein [Acidobacteriota bacterium]
MEKNLPLVRVTVNGEPLTFILDSAAAGCVIDRERAASLGLTASGIA